MSFEGYSPAALDFLWGIRFNNERGWFLAHKEDYQSHVLAPPGRWASRSTTPCTKSIPTSRFC